MTDEQMWRGIILAMVPGLKMIASLLQRSTARGQLGGGVPAYLCQGSRRIDF
jgi:hypothetical protein